MKRCLVTVLLAASVAQASDWPFAILRSYGPYEKNRVFTDRVFAAQERHPGLFDEIWFGVDAEPFGNPDGADAPRTLLLHVSLRPRPQPAQGEVDHVRASSRLLLAGRRPAHPQA